LRFYHTPNYLIGHYKEEEVQKIAAEMTRILEKYMKPAIFPLPTLSIINLQNLQKERTTKTICNISLEPLLRTCAFTTSMITTSSLAHFQAEIAGIDQEKSF
jgi:hypothetical protein